MVLCIEHFLYVFYTFQIIRLIVSDDMTLLAKKIFEFMIVIFILGTAIKISQSPEELEFEITKTERCDFVHDSWTMRESIDSRL